jgi:hypothetical protein
VSAQDTEAAISDVNRTVGMGRKVGKKIWANPQKSMFKTASFSDARSQSIVQCQILFSGKGIADWVLNAIWPTSHDHSSV